MSRFPVLAPGIVDLPTRQPGEVVYYGSRFTGKHRIYQYDDNGLIQLAPRPEWLARAPGGFRWGDATAETDLLGYALCSLFLTKQEVNRTFKRFSKKHLQTLAADCWRYPADTLHMWIIAALTEGPIEVELRHDELHRIYRSHGECQS